jgi:type I restriction enzyme S subunit
VTSWPTLPLRRLFSVVNGGTPTSDGGNWNGGLPWATPVDLARVDGGVLGVTDRTLTESGLASGSRSVPAGSLLLSTRAPIGYVAETAARTAFNQGCRGLSSKIPLTLRYFRYQLSSVGDRLQAWGQGSTFVELSGDALAAFPLVAPPLPAQRAIADYLDRETARIDALITAKRRMVELLEERVHTLRSRWYDLLAAEVGTVPLRRMLTSLEQGWSPRCDNYPATKGEWGVLKTSSVSGGTFSCAENKRLPETEEPDLRWVVQDDDLLVVRGSGSLAAVGQAAVARVGKHRLLLSDLLYRVRLRSAAPEFVASALRSPQARQQVEGAVRSDVGQTLKVRGDDLKSLLIPAAKPSRQVEVVRALRLQLDPLDNASRDLGRSIALLQERRQALITAAVTGQIHIPEAA